MGRPETNYSIYKFGRDEEGKYIVPEDFLDEWIPLINMETGEKRFGTTGPRGRQLNEYLEARPGFEVIDCDEKNLREDRVILWNKETGRKLSGKSAPKRQNVEEYVRRNPEWEVYSGQTQSNIIGGEGNSQVLVMWNKNTKRKLTGNAAPRRRDLDRFLARHPEYEVYHGQDKAIGGSFRARLERMILDGEVGDDVIFRDRHFREAINQILWDDEGSNSERSSNDDEMREAGDQMSDSGGSVHYEEMSDSDQGRLHYEEMSDSDQEGSVQDEQMLHSDLEGIVQDEHMGLEGIAQYEGSGDGTSLENGDGNKFFGSYSNNEQMSDSDQGRLHYEEMSDSDQEGSVQDEQMLNSDLEGIVQDEHMGLEGIAQYEDSGDGTSLENGDGNKFFGSNSNNNGSQDLEFHESKEDIDQDYLLDDYNAAITDVVEEGNPGREDQEIEKRNIPGLVGPDWETMDALLQNSVLPLPQPEWNFHLMNEEDLQSEQREE